MIVPLRPNWGLPPLALGYRGDVKGGDKVPEELIGQAIKFVVMHEVGHTLGLRHNFKASTMLANDKLHDTSTTATRAWSARSWITRQSILPPKA